MQPYELLDDGIAVVALTGRFPGARDVDELWKLLQDGREGITDISDADLRASGLTAAQIRKANYVKRAGLLDNIEEFDGACFGYSGRQATLLDPQQRVLLECAYEVLDAAGQNGLTDKKIGVFAGSTQSNYATLYIPADSLSNPGEVFEARMSAEKDFVATRVSYKLNLTGPSVAVQTACSSSLVAVHLACQSLLSFESDVAVAGGVAIRLPHRIGYTYQDGGILSRDGRCRAFDANANGTVPGAGVGLVALMRLKDALEEGCQVHAVIRGTAINNDGAAKAGFAAPSVQGQVDVVTSALAAASVEPLSVGLIEGHGTGTRVGDDIELEALNEVFGNAHRPRRTCALGSIKSNIGHLDAAAGVAGLIKAILCVKHGLYVPTLHQTDAPASLQAEGCPFFTPTSVEGWAPSSNPRRAGISSFGIGGTNAHVLVEEAPPRRAVAKTPREELVVISGRTDVARGGASKQLAAYLKHLRTSELPDAADVAYTLGVGRKHWRHRDYVVTSSSEELIERLDAGQVSGSGDRETDDERPVVLVFTGWGHEHVENATAIWQEDGDLRAQLMQCRDVFLRDCGVDITADLSHTEMREQHDQCAAAATLFTLQYCMAKQYLRWGLRIDAVIGYGFGEYAAACCAGVITVQEVAKLLCARARVPASCKGAMLSIGRNADEILPMLAGSTGIAARNSPHECVVSGPESEIATLAAELAGRAIPYERILSAWALHTETMRPVSAAVERVAHEISCKSATLPCASTVTGKWAWDKGGEHAGYWGRQVCGTVQFDAAITAVLSRYRRPIFLGIGPWDALSGTVTSVPVVGGEKHDCARVSLAEPIGRGALLSIIGELWCKRASVDLRGLFRGRHCRRLSLPGHQFERKRHWPELARSDISSAPIAGGERHPLQQWFYTPSWRPTVGPANAGSLASPDVQWVVFSDSLGAASCIVEYLEKQGLEAIVVRRGSDFGVTGDGGYSLSPSAPDHYEKLRQSWETRGIVHPRIAYFWGLEGPEPEGLLDSDDDRLVRVPKELLLLIKSLGSMRTREDVSLLVVTAPMRNVAGADRASPARTAIRAICEVANQEIPRLRCAVCDVAERPADTEENLWASPYAEWIAGELVNGLKDLVVSYTNGTRLVQAHERLVWARQSAATDPFVKGGVYVLVGGLGRIGLCLARFLARTAQARLVLVTRRQSIPERATWMKYAESPHTTEPLAREIRALVEIESSGGRVAVMSGDVSDADRMRQIFDDVERDFGQLNGVFHLAAETSHESSHERLLAAKPEHFLVQARPKAGGLRVLKEVLRGRSCDFVAVFSSNAAILGGIGSAAYAAANAALHGFSLGKGSRQRWVVISWDTWLVGDAIDMTGRLGPDSQVSMAALTESEALDALRVALTFQGVTHVIVSALDLAARSERPPRPDDMARADHENAHNGKAGQLDNRASREPTITKSVLEQQILDIWSEVLDVSKIDMDDDFFALGGDSLVALQVLSRVHETFGVELSMDSLFDGTPTVAGMCVEVLAALVSKLDGEEAESELKGLEEGHCKPAAGSNFPGSFAQ